MQTVRKDLRYLAERGVMARAYGGAIDSNVVAPPQAEPHYEAKRTSNLEQKRRIGQRAAALVNPGATIAIDSGTTSIQLAEALPNIELTVVTNDFAQITLDFSTEWREFHREGAPDLLPGIEAGAEHLDEMWSIIARVFTEVNNGVYRCGFAGSQDAYDAAYAQWQRDLAEWEEQRAAATNAAANRAAKLQELQARMYADVLLGRGVSHVECAFVCVERDDGRGGPVVVRYAFDEAPGSKN